MDIQIKIAGRFTTWNFVESFDHQVLKDAFDSIGAGNLAPNPRSKIAALRLVLDKEYSGAGLRLVVPARAPQGTFIITQTVGDGIDIEKSKIEGERDISRVNVKPSVVCKAWVASDANGMEVVEAEFTPIEGTSAPIDLPNLRQRVNASMAHVDARDLVLKVSALLDRWRALPLRSGGGAYFLPEIHVPEWNKIRAAVASASIGNKKAAIHTAPFVADSEFGELVVSSLGHDLRTKLSQLEDGADDRGDRGLHTKAAQAHDLRNLVNITETKLVDLAARAAADRASAKNERANARAAAKAAAKAADKVVAAQPIVTAPINTEEEVGELDEAQENALAALGI